MDPISNKIWKYKETSARFLWAAATQVPGTECWWHRFREKLETLKWSSSTTQEPPSLSPAPPTLTALVMWVLLYVLPMPTSLEFEHGPVIQNAELMNVYKQRNASETCKYEPYLDFCLSWWGRIMELAQKWPGHCCLRQGDRRAWWLWAA